MNAERTRYRRLIWATAIAFPTLALWSAWDLRNFESGGEPHVRLWLPLAFLYEHFGYWPTVLALPILGLLCIGVFVYRLKNLR